MKQKINKTRTRIIKNVTRNLARLFWAIVCHTVIELRFKFKFLCQDISAFIKGYGSHAKRIQYYLDHNHKIYAGMKQYEGFCVGGKIHKWEDAVLY